LNFSFLDFVETVKNFAGKWS